MVGSSASTISRPSRAADSSAAGGRHGSRGARGKRRRALPLRSFPSPRTSSWPGRAARPTTPPTALAPLASTDPPRAAVLQLPHPAKGALSADTWRAITVIARNLVITLLTLLPILGAGVFLAQLYFTADSNLAAPFVCGRSRTFRTRRARFAAGLPLEGPDGSTTPRRPGPGPDGGPLLRLFDPPAPRSPPATCKVRFARARCRS